MYVAGCDRTRAANEQNCVKDTLQGLSNLAGSKLQLREVVFLAVHVELIEQNFAPLELGRY